eukprot:Skav206524  [mRNA]  locus=scaffold5046:146584:158793:- [translate_table: standard]
MRIVPGFRSHGSALRARRQKLRAVLGTRRFADVKPEELQSFYHHPVDGEVPTVLVVANEGHGDQNDNHKEKAAQNHEVILFFQKKSRKANANLVDLRAIRIPKLLPVPLGDFISQSLVGFGNLNEARGS